MRRYALRDDQWERIKELLPGRPGHVGVTAKDNRLFVEAVLHRYRTGIPWRHLPERFTIKDEIYQHKNFSRDKIHVLARLDASKLDYTKPNSITTSQVRTKGAMRRVEAGSTPQSTPRPPH